MPSKKHLVRKWFQLTRSKKAEDKKREQVQKSKIKQRETHILLGQPLVVTPIIGTS